MRGRRSSVPALACPQGDPELREGQYLVRFARDQRDLERVLRLRFEVFNVELGEGLEQSWLTGLDEDAFDRSCHHLMLCDEGTQELVGTYRLQTAQMAQAGAGFNGAQQFDLAGLPPEVVAQAIELGRACITEKHRNGTALFALWRGLAWYVQHCAKRYLFGCCSLTSQDPREGLALQRHLERQGRVSAKLFVWPLPGLGCVAPDVELPEIRVPKLFGTYLRYGAVACGPPAIDRAFKTIDFFIVLDVEALDPRVRALFFHGLGRDR